jgi:IS30 family transposase
MDTPGTPNPLCACGCGFEVALPNNRYIQGHAGAIRLTEDERRELKKMLGARVSSYKIAARFGRSQAQVLNWRERGVPEQRPAPRVLRKEDLERIAAVKEARKRSRMEARLAKEKKEKFV